MPLIPVLRLRQGNHEFEPHLGYRKGPCLKTKAKAKTKPDHCHHHHCHLKRNTILKQGIKLVSRAGHLTFPSKCLCSSPIS